MKFQSLLLKNSRSDLNLDPNLGFSLLITLHLLLYALCQQWSASWCLLSCQLLLGPARAFYSFIIRGFDNWYFFAKIIKIKCQIRAPDFIIAPPEKNVSIFWSSIKLILILSLLLIQFSLFFRMPCAQEFHSKYYHPSNARIWFYGDDDLKERLRVLSGKLQI